MRTTRRTAVSVLLALGGGTALYCSTLDQAAWRAYEAVEEAWIRDRHALLIEGFPECIDAAAIDLDLRLAELQRRGMQFEYLNRHNPRLLQGGMWQLTWIPLSPAELAKISATNRTYRMHEEKIRHMTETLRRHTQYENFRQAQTRLWKTPAYHSVHRRYTGRLTELNKVYGGSAEGSP